MTKLDGLTRFLTSHEIAHEEWRRRAERHHAEALAEDSSRQAWAEVRADSDRKAAARIALRRAVRDGRIAKPTRCEDCGSTPAPRHLHGHHGDHEKPLEVRWLCRTCHVRADRQPRGRAPRLAAIHHFMTARGAR